MSTTKNAVAGKWVVRAGGEFVSSPMPSRSANLQMAAVFRSRREADMVAQAEGGEALPIVTENFMARIVEGA